MPSPIAHMLVGLTIARRSRVWNEPVRVRWILLAVFAANAPDLDFLFGLAAGAINRYHPNPSHSVLAALIFALVATLVLGRTWTRPLRLFGLTFGLYGSHILLDMFGDSSPAPPGVQLFWPLSDAGFVSPWRPLLGIVHGSAEGGNHLFLQELLSRHNLGAVALELVIFLPLLWLSTRRASA